MTEKTNDLKQITDVVPKNELDTPKDRDSQFIDEYLSCLDVREAGRRLGYAETTINSGYLYQKFKKPEFQEKLKRAAIARDYQDLALIYSLERLGLQEIANQAKDRPKSIIGNLSTLKHIAKQKKQISGILGQESPPLKATVSIQEIRQIYNMSSTPISIKHAVEGEVLNED